jgi:HNH endonuclease
MVGGWVKSNVLSVIERSSPPVGIFGVQPAGRRIILVAEEILRRYLLAGESIHHRNGIRDDNRPENLELWTRPQPSGIRVSDAIAWARTVLDRYEGVDAPPTMLTVAPEHSWRWRESNPRPSASQRDFSERSR